MPDNPQQWIALLGRGSGAPTDGLEDYCARLGEALDLNGVSLEFLRVPWVDDGWRRSLRWLRNKLAGAQGRVVLVQYTALAWSRHGYLSGAPSVLRTLKRCGARPVVVFHDTSPFAGTRMRDRVRRRAQIRVMRSLVRASSQSVCALPPDRLRWLPASLHHRFALVAIGSNVEEGWRREEIPVRRERPGIAIFGVNRNQIAEHAAQIGRIVSAAARNAGPVRLVVFGLGASQAEAALRSEIGGAPVTLEPYGILSPGEICERFLECAVQLFITSGVSACRGSVVAGICCGLPVVGWQDHDTAHPITEAGLWTAPPGDEAGLIRGLSAVLTDDAVRAELSRKSKKAAQEHFSWDRIAMALEAAIPAAKR